MSSHTKLAYLSQSLTDKQISFFSAFLGSVCLAALSQISFPLPYSPIPVTMQTLGLFLLAGMLGSKRAFYSVMIYLFKGTCGLPVFAGFAVNPLWFCTPKGGYLIAFALAVFAMGKLFEIFKRKSFIFSLLVFIVGNIIILGIGALWLSFFVGVSNAASAGIIPFLPGAAAKMIAAACIIKGLQLSRSHNFYAN